MKLTLVNFRHHKNLQLDLPSQGVVLFSGASGQGKSTVLSALEFLLYGTLKKVSTFDSKKTSVTLVYDGIALQEFKDQDNDIPASITISRRRDPTFFEVTCGNNSYIGDEAQGIVDRMFGSEEVFMASSYLRQGERSILLDGKSVDKLEMVEQFTFSNSNIKSVKETISAKCREAEKELLLANGGLAVLEAQLESYRVYNTRQLATYQEEVAKRASPTVVLSPQVIAKEVNELTSSSERKWHSKNNCTVSEMAREAIVRENQQAAEQISLLRESIRVNYSSESYASCETQLAASQAELQQVTLLSEYASLKINDNMQAFTFVKQHGTISAEQAQLSESASVIVSILSQRSLLAEVVQLEQALLANKSTELRNRAIAQELLELFSGQAPTCSIEELMDESEVVNLTLQYDKLRHYHPIDLPHSKYPTELKTLALLQNDASLWRRTLLKKEEELRVLGLSSLSELRELLRVTEEKLARCGEKVDCPQCRSVLIYQKGALRLHQLASPTVVHCVTTLPSTLVAASLALPKSSLPKSSLPKSLPKPSLTIRGSNVSSPTRLLINDASNSVAITPVNKAVLQEKALALVTAQALPVSYCSEAPQTLMRQISNLERVILLVSSSPPPLLSSSTVAECENEIAELEALRELCQRRLSELPFLLARDKLQEELRGRNSIRSKEEIASQLRALNRYKQLESEVKTLHSVDSARITILQSQLAAVESNRESQRLSTLFYNQRDSQLSARARRLLLLAKIYKKENEAELSLRDEGKLATGYREVSEVQDEIALLQRELVAMKKARTLSDKIEVLNSSLRIVPPSSADRIKLLDEELDHLKKRITALNTLSDCLNVALKLQYLSEELEQQRMLWKEATKKLAVLDKLKLKSLEAESLALESTVAMINLEVATQLEYLFDSPITVRFETSKSSASGKVKHCINLAIMYRGVIYDDIKYLSGGESARISLAVTLALCKSANSPLLMLDESLSALDSELIDTVIDALKLVSDRYTIPIFLVLHNSCKGVFDNVIEF